MTNTLTEISEDDFDAQYQLVKNHLNPHATWVQGDGLGCLFETYGPELEFVRQQNPSAVWTLVDGDDGDQYLISGYHFVNRIGYLVSTIPVHGGKDIQVHLPMESETDDEAVEQQADTIPNMPPSAADRCSTDTPPPAAVTPLLVLKGEPLLPGKMYLRLYHGRTNPDQEMDDWGFDGPTFGPLACYVHTYCCTFRIHAESGFDELWLDKFDDMIRWDGSFYGDMEIFIAIASDKA